MTLRRNTTNRYTMIFLAVLKTIQGFDTEPKMLLSSVVTFCFSEEPSQGLSLEKNMV